MTENRVVTLRQKGAIDDPLTEILRTGARRLIAQAVEAEFETFLASTAELVLPDGRRRVVRHGHDPVRAIQTGIGPVEVQKPKARDRAAASGERLRFSSNILPKWARRTKSLDALLPVLYLRGISAGDFQEALAALLGKDAPNLSTAVIARLKSAWEDEYRRWQKRDLSARSYVYVWADGVYLQARRRPPEPAARSRAFGFCTSTGPIPVWIARTGSCPWRTTRRRPSASTSSAVEARNVSNSASTAWAINRRAPVRRISVSGSSIPPFCRRATTLVSVMA